MAGKSLWDRRSISDEDPDDSRFAFTVPQKLYCSRGCGQIRESLFNDRFEELVDMLIVPVPVDSIMLNITRRTSESTLPRYGDWMREVVKKLQRIPKAISCQTDSSATGRDLVTNLPSEIILEIFKNINGIEDTFTFGLACRRTWAFAARIICEWERSWVGPWAGERIVAVGPPCDDNDYPPGLFSAQEIEILTQESVIEENHNGEPTSWQFEISSFALVEVYADMPPPSPAPYYELRWCIDILMAGGLMDAALDSVAHEFDIRMSEYAPDTESWMLRNLTTREFVPASAVAINAELINGPRIAIRGFHHLLLARTCWMSTDNGRVLLGDLPVSPRGSWAGHRFEICTTTHHEEHAKATGQDWTDVGDQVKVELDTIWEANYGSDWRSIVCDAAFRPPDSRGSLVREFSTPWR